MQDQSLSEDLNMDLEYRALSLAFSPAGHLYLYADTENLSITLSEKIQEFFSISDSVGLLRLGLSNFSVTLPASFAFWQRFAQIFITELCKHTTIEAAKIVLPRDEINQLIEQAPFIRGIEYFNQDKANLLWQGLIKALSEELRAFDGQLDNYLSAFHSAWNTIGRVCFHLAENKSNSEYPFAFMATYTTGLSKNSNTQHLPLGKALEEYAGKSKNTLLLSLLMPVHRASEKSPFLKALVESGRIFKPLAWSAREAHQFLKDIPQF